VRGLWEFWNGNFVVTVEELVEYLVADCLIGIHGVSYVGVRNDLYLMSNDLLRHTPISFSSDLLLFEELVEYGEMLLGELWSAGVPILWNCGVPAIAPAMIIHRFR